MSGPVVFVSYSHDDEAEMQALMTHLGVLDAAGLLAVWNDDRIGAGADWRAEISAMIGRAQVAILLVTVNFLTSEFILGSEAPALLRRREAEGLTVIPVIARACAWQRVAWLAALQVRPRNGRPVWGDLGVHVDEDLTALALEVATLVGEGVGRRSSESPPAAGELAAPGPLPVGSRLPYIRNRFFAGRAADLLWLADALPFEGPVTEGCPTAVLTGLGGLGKTQLAVEFAYRYGRFFPGGVYWVDFADPDAIGASVARSGRGRGLHPDYENLKQDEQVQLVQQAWAEPTPRLLLFDNADDSRAVQEVGAWRPQLGSGCRVLVTSRRGVWPKGLRAVALSLGTLDRTDSIALLRRHREDAAEEALDALAAEVGDLPLALHLVGGFLESYAGDPVGEPTALLNRLRDPALLARERSVLTGRGATASPTAHELSVARTFGLSYERLDAHDPTDRLALALLARAAYFAPGEPIPWPLLAATLADREGVSVDELDLADARRRLVGLGLLQVAGSGDLKIHSLLVRFVQAHSDVAPAQDAVERVVLAEARRLNDEGYPAPLQAWLPHLRHIVDVALVRGDERAVALSDELSKHLFSNIADYAGARPYLAMALAARKQIWGDRHPDTAASLHDLGTVHMAQGDYAGARPYLEEALATRRTVLGKDHPDTAESLNNLGALLHYVGELAGARRYFEEALAIRRAVRGDRHPDTASTINNLGALLRLMGDLAGARPYYEEALAIRQAVLGDRHPRTAQSLNNLGALLRHLGDYAGARPHLEEALDIRQEALGSGHPATAVSLNNIGLLRQDMGDLAGARPCYEAALRIRREALGERHPDTAQSLNNLGQLLLTMGDYAEARPCLDEALDIRREVFGDSHPETARSLGNIGDLLRTTGDYAGARAHYEAAQAVMAAAFGPKHLETSALDEKLKELAAN